MDGEDVRMMLPSWGRMGRKKNEDSGDCWSRLKDWNELL